MGEISVTSSRYAKSHQAHDFSRKHHHAAKKSSSWWNSPETKRKKRVAGYKFYAVEGRVKSSVKKGSISILRAQAPSIMAASVMHS
ncbi:hypothetical protein SADUNF_Sadunf05G0009900 [Salix dunnii]|uniref:Uncharacterized protein n=1 Tax=Salix dunnii TaxID=1413687 RepID=A0A835N3F5_9ROSI|nr:hypothetical protein SADUNF_Sadunf05G0009900 [Salix dunnii]